MNSSVTEKRAFLRHAVNLQAVCIIPELGEWACEVRDFCIGGMYLIYKNKAETNGAIAASGTIIELHCTVPAVNGEKRLPFQGRILRTDERGIGIALLNPDLNALQTINEHIQTQHSKSSTEEKPPSDNHGNIRQNSDETLSSCKNLIEESFEPLIKETQERIVDALFNAAEKSKDVTQQNAYFDSLNILNRSNDKLKDTFSSSASALLNTYCSKPNSIDQASNERANDNEMTLSLIEEDVLEDWLAVTEITNVAKAKNHDALISIERQLSTLYQISIAEKNNPFGPILFAQAFENGIKEIALDHKADQLCYTVYKETLNTTLVELYKKISALLTEHGFSPENKPKIKTQTRPNKVMPQSQSIDNTTPIQPQSEPEPVVAQESFEHMPFSEPQQEQQAQSSFSGATSGGYPAEPVANHMAPQAQASHQALPIEAAANQPATQAQASNQDIYQLVQTLRGLQHLPNTPAQQSSTLQTSVNSNTESVPGAETSSRVTAASPGAPGTENTATPTPTVYSPTEVLSALSHLQDNTATQQATQHISNGSVSSQVLTILTGNSSDDENKLIGDRETGIMEVGGHLFASMFRDRLVSNNVRAWIKRLEIPMLKLAIVDDSLFIDKSHVARQVINKISQLELYGEDNPITTRVNGLLDRIVKEVGVTPDIFEQVLKEIDLLIQVQNKAYADNLKDVVTECEIEQARLDADKNNSDAKDNKISDPQLEQWLKQVRRIKIGSWLLFSSESDNPARLRLAWRAKDKNRYVFVNLRGIKEISYTIEELAVQLRNGTAVVLDNANDPAMDRAQYQMLQNMHHQLLHEATHDQLTGLINRREFESCLRKAFSTAQQENTQHVLYFLDLDHLNVVNTTCGYDAGDKLLIEVTTLLQKKIAQNGILARIGGDEFAILLTDCTIDDALKIAQQQKDAMQGYRLSWEDKRLSVAVSIGMVEINGKEISSATLLQAAESSCKAAKRKGSNSIQLFSHDDAELSLQQKTLEWAARIDQALDENTLELRCQRIALIQDDETLPPHHSEILLGVTDEEGNTMSPQEFILAAEQYHRMPEVDRWVIRNVFNWMVEHEEQLNKTGGLSINLSGSSLNDDSFMGFVLEEIKTTQVPTNKVCFEITETAGIANLSDAVEFIEEIKKTGCQFSLDDFGSGLSSYGYLKNLPVDYLKIDGAFVKDLNNSPSDYAVVKSITEVGHFMGKKIIAEYVENDAILELLREIGVDYAQGYGIEKPYKLSDLTSVKSCA